MADEQQSTGRRYPALRGSARRGLGETAFRKYYFDVLTLLREKSGSLIVDYEGFDLRNRRSRILFRLPNEGLGVKLWITKGGENGHLSVFVALYQGTNRVYGGFLSSDETAPEALLDSIWRQVRELSPQDRQLVLGTAVPSAMVRELQP